MEISEIQLIFFVMHSYSLFKTLKSFYLSTHLTYFSIFLIKRACNKYFNCKIDECSINRRENMLIMRARPKPYEELSLTEGLDDRVFKLA